MVTFMRLAAALATILPLCAAAVPAARAVAPTVTIPAPQATIVGLAGDVEQFPGIPFAKPPTGGLRLKPPQPLTEPYGTYKATQNGKACPQFYFSSKLNDAIPTAEIGMLLNSPLFQKITNAGEDCLQLNVHRPAGTKPGDKLPVLFWIFGGGFELGYNSMYSGAPWVKDSIERNQPIIFVSVNYRVGGFGFMPGAEIKKDGSSNLGLLDQRLGLEWVADNIAAFGGDPSKVTIWGESAGAISVFDQMALYGGDNTYKGKPLFRGGIMNSGSVVPADPVDSVKGQLDYDAVVKEAGCAGSSDTLNCLRGVDYTKFLNAANSVPGLLSYSSVALSYLPRPDGKVLTQSPDVIASSGKFAKVPFIIGDQEDEGTIFALFQSNISSTAQLENYVSEKFFLSATKDQVKQLVALYSNTITNGSPFRSGILNNWYPQFKRLAAILGDLTFTLTRRTFLDVAARVNPTVPSWSYLSSYDFGTPILGTFHGSDLLQVFFGVVPNYASKSFRDYYINFVYNLDPNKGTTVKNWPQWSNGKQLLSMYPLSSTLITDDFRSDIYDFIVANVKSLYIRR